MKAIDAVNAATCEALSVHYGLHAGLRHIDLVIPQGRFTAILGPNGAGKSSLIKALAGLVHYTGSISILGKPFNALDRRERARTISYLAQGHAIAWPMTAEAVVALGRAPHTLSASLGKTDGEAVRSAFERTGTLDFRHRLVFELSHGERARILLARALAVEAPLLLADEPIAALDPYQQLKTLDILKEETARGRTPVAVMHDLALAAAYADHIVLLKNGTLVAAGAPDEVLSATHLGNVFRLEVYGEELRFPLRPVGN